MKHVFTPLVLLILGFNCVAQTNAFREKAKWDSPNIPSSFIRINKIKAIHVRCFKDKTEPQGEFTSGTSYKYDSKGNLHQVVEIKSKDTSRIHNYVYTERGILGSKVVNDKTWNKKYKKRFRFNQKQRVFQEKSYEMLYNNEVMLLNTKQYIYDDDSVLVAIRWMENNKVVRTQKYKYDDDFNVREEIFEDGSGELVKKVSYNYNANSLVTKVTTEKLDAPLEEFVYDYNTNGKKTQVLWQRGGELVGKVAYTYDPNGVLARMNREIYQKSKDQPSHLCQVFEYEKFD